MATQTQVALVSPPSVSIELHNRVPGTAGELLVRDDLSSNDAEEVPPVSLFRKATVLAELSGINFASSAVNGIVVVGLPVISKDINLAQSLSLWPTSVASLSNASTLLLAGSIADCIGSRTVNLAGGVVNGVFTLGSGLSQTGAQLVAMRALSGIGYAMHLASSVSIVTHTFPQGRGRNFAFSCLGLSQPLGFSFGLVLGGVLEQVAGWRVGWYMYSGLMLALTCLAFWALPKTQTPRTLREAFSGMKHTIDWVGALVASMFMAMLSYLLATISADVQSIRKPESIVFLCISVLAAPFFIWWMRHQVSVGKPALIPNSLWRNTAFSSICATVTISFGVTTGMELFASLFFQEVQELSALQAGLRILPSLVVGTILNFTTGYLVDRIPAIYLVALPCVVCSAAPLLMAVIKTQAPYWSNAFVAQLLAPISTDILFTVGLIVISENFPDNTQALAGAVFNTASQFGQALMLAILQVVSSMVTKESNKRPERLAVMEGLRASFWAMFAFMMACVVLASVSARRDGWD